MNFDFVDDLNRSCEGDQEVKVAVAESCGIPVVVPSYRALSRLTEIFIPSFAEHMYASGRHHYFLVVAAEGYDDAELGFIADLLDSYFGTDYVLRRVSYPKPAPMALIRDDASALVSHFDFHLLCDDDFQFKSGSVEKYDDCVDYMVKNPQCGAVQAKSFLGGSKWGNDVRPAFGGLFFTAQGLLVRMIRDDGCRLFPSQVLHIPGGWEDDYLGFHFWSRGYFTAKIMNCPTIHRHSAWGTDKINVRMEGAQAVDISINGKNPQIVSAGMGLAINRLVGERFYVDGSEANMKRMLVFRPSLAFWKRHVKAAIDRFGHWALEGMDKKSIQRAYSTSLSELGLAGYRGEHRDPESISAVA